MSEHTPWAIVMEGMTGTRLALWDDAVAEGRIYPHTREEKDAGEWLYQHRLMQWDEDYLIPIEISTARQEWEQHGPREQLTSTPAAPRPTTPLPAPDPRPRTHDHQTEMNL